MSTLLPSTQLLGMSTTLQHLLWTATLSTKHIELKNLKTNMNISKSREAAAWQWLDECVSYHSNSTNLLSLDRNTKQSEGSRSTGSHQNRMSSKTSCPNKKSEEGRFSFTVCLMPLWLTMVWKEPDNFPSWPFSCGNFRSISMDLKNNHNILVKNVDCGNAEKEMVDKTWHWGLLKKKK